MFARLNPGNGRYSADSARFLRAALGYLLLNMHKTFKGHTLYGQDAGDTNEVLSAFLQSGYNQSGSSSCLNNHSQRAKLETYWLGNVSPNWRRWTEVVFTSRDIPLVLLAARYCLHVTCALQILLLVPQVTLIGVTEAGYTHKDNWAVCVPISPFPTDGKRPIISCPLRLTFEIILCSDNRLQLS